MTKRITKAIAKYQAATTSGTIKTSIRRFKAMGIKQSVADIRWSAAMDLRDAIEQGMPQ
jgi:hypothetical protein